MMTSQGLVLGKAWLPARVTVCEELGVQKEDF